MEVSAAVRRIHMSLGFKRLINYVLGRSSHKALMSSFWVLPIHLAERTECKCEKYKTGQCTHRDSNQWPLKCKTEPLSLEPFCSLNFIARFFNRTAAISGKVRTDSLANISVSQFCFSFPTPPLLSISLIRLSVLNSDQISPRIAPISILYQQKAATLNSE